MNVGSMVLVNVGISDVGSMVIAEVDPSGGTDGKRDGKSLGNSDTSWVTSTVGTMVGSCDGTKVGDGDGK
jgi:hypothetical protein